MTLHVVPAARILTVVHIQDPAVSRNHVLTPDNRRRAGAVQLTADSYDGQTVCGQPMAVGEQWLPWTYRARHDRLCPDCEAGTATFTEEAMF